MTDKLILIFTDLDGTLLNHHDYHFDAAIPAIKKLLDLNIPIIYNTSKTIEECLELQALMGLDQPFPQPFIVENGSALICSEPFDDSMQRIQIGQYSLYGLTLGANLDQISKTLSDLAWEQSLYTPFSKATVETIVDYTGLTIEQATQAKQRRYSDPVIWHGNEEQKEAFIQAIHNRGLTTLQGGRFLHILGNTNKGMALTKMAQIYSKARFSSTAENATTIALGDSPNDLAMLSAADIAIHVLPASNQAMEFQHPNKIVTQLKGAAGWAEGIKKALEQLKIHL